MQDLKISEKSGMVLLAVRVQPRAGANRVAGCHNGALKIRVAAPPVQGRANLELLRFLASLLGLQSKDLCLVRGLKSRDKSVGIKGLTRDQVVERLARYLIQ